MGVKGSYIAADIMREYRAKQHYQNNKRMKCKEVDCSKCKFYDICTESNSETKH